MTAKTETPERADDGKLHCGCGETFTTAGWYARHALKCTGKPVQKRGRIDRLAARRRRTTPAASHVKRERRRPVHAAPAAVTVTGPTPRETRKSVEAQLAHAKSIVELEIPSCTRCLHAPVCILRARITDLADSLITSAADDLARVRPEEERPTVIVAVGCSLYIAEDRS